MAVNSGNNEKIRSVAHILNMSFDELLQTLIVQTAGFDGRGIQRNIADSVATKITEDGAITYIAIAAPGTAESEAKWQVKKLDETTGLVITYADGDADFNNVATDLTALTYS